MTGCRISKVTNKATGRELRILPTNKNVNHDTVERLIEALDMARNGKLKAFGIVAVLDDNHISTGFSESMRENAFAGVACCELLKSRIMRTLS